MREKKIFTLNVNGGISIRLLDSTGSNDCDNNILSIWVLKSLNVLREHLNTSLFKNAYFMIIGTAATSILGFIFWIVATRYFAAEIVGLGSAIISSLGLLAIFSELGLGIGLIRFLPGAGRKSNDMLNTCLTICGISSITISIIFLAGIEYWSPALQLVRSDPIFFLCFIIFSVIFTLQPLLLNVFLAKRDTIYLLYTNLINCLFRLVFVIIASIIFNSSFGFFFAIGLAGTLSLSIAIFWFVPKVQKGYHPRPMIERDVMHESWHYSISNYISRCLLQLTPVILPLMVVNILSAEMNAYFVIAWAVTSLLFVIPSSISNSLFAEGSNDEKSLQFNCVKSLKLMLLLLLPLTIILFIIADNFLLLFGQNYSDNGANLLRILVISAIPYGVNYFYISIARIDKNINILLKIAFSATCLSLGLSYYLMLKMSLMGIGIGYLVGQSIVAGAVIIVLRKSCLFNLTEVFNK